MTMQNTAEAAPDKELIYYKVERYERDKIALRWRDGYKMRAFKTNTAAATIVFPEHHRHLSLLNVDQHSQDCFEPYLQEEMPRVVALLVDRQHR